MLGLVLMLVACGEDDTTGDNDSDSDADVIVDAEDEGFDLVSEGELTFAASGEFKPFSYMEGNEMVGYDAAVGRAIAEHMGLEPNAERATFSGIVTGVSEGRYDMAVASHTITEERLEEVDFSIPYYYSGPVVWVRSDSDVASEADLEGLEIAVARGTTYLDMAEEYTDNIPQLDSDVVALQSLDNGHYDVVITDDVTGNEAINNGLDLKPAFYLGVSEQGVAVNKDNPELLAAVNEILQEMIDSGELKELAEEWVGSDITVEPEGAE
ncbi:amino acid ABC transporter substrate-binding protein (PAAT family) [Streptohalobacillus salinus]|uniref:Amino acid ABC transporter substrate-binding protein (PAAT family) n=2 Tax=Streptohalobacillus salinus TaxID=621096 RepID=A0A2V3WI33_9BACI|nr:amino acid ABC transporter substrate-binding protein (PAAT family) [Streptohalobacillus salinus]